MSIWLGEVGRPNAKSSVRRRRGSTSISDTSSRIPVDAAEANVDEDVAVAIEATSEAEGVDAAANSEVEAKADSVVVVVDATAVTPPTLATRTLSQLSVARSYGTRKVTKSKFDSRAITLLLCLLQSGIVAHREACSYMSSDV